MEKKFLIPIILGVLLLCGIVFTVVYKNTSGSSPNNDPIVQTLAPKETEPVETKVVSGDKEFLEDFNINKVKPNETKVAYVDEQGDILSDEEVKNIEESEIESIAQLAEQASISAQSIKKDI